MGEIVEVGETSQERTKGIFSRRHCHFTLLRMAASWCRRYSYRRFSPGCKNRTEETDGIDEIQGEDLEFLIEYHGKKNINDAWRELVSELRFEVFEQIDKVRDARMLKRGWV